MIFIALKFELNLFFEIAWTMFANAQASPIHATPPVLSFWLKFLMSSEL
jgi:hypothetical protein